MYVLNVSLIVVLILPGDLHCGHYGCMECFATAIATSGRCPTCRAPADADDVRPAPSVDAMIGGLKCKCPNHENGCSFVGSFGRNGSTLAKHLEICGYRKVQCK